MLFIYHHKVIQISRLQQHVKYLDIKQWNYYLFIIICLHLLWRPTSAFVASDSKFQSGLFVKEIEAPKIMGRICQEFLKFHWPKKAEENLRRQAWQCLVLTVDESIMRLKNFCSSWKEAGGQMLEMGWQDANYVQVLEVSHSYLMNNV